MTYIVEAPASWFLRGTVFTGDKSRASTFDSESAAQAAIAKAAQFSKPKMVKTWKIVPVEG
jgi:hypothetical protein